MIEKCSDQAASCSLSLWTGWKVLREVPNDVLTGIAGLADGIPNPRALPAKSLKKTRYMILMVQVSERFQGLNAVRIDGDSIVGMNDPELNYQNTHYA